LKRILSICNQAFYKQLRDWMIFGLLHDKYSEFIICLKESTTEPPKNDITSQDTSTQTVLDQLTSNHQNENSYFSQYTLNAAMYPVFLDQKVADKILFIGEALQLFQLKTNWIDKALDDNIEENKKAQIELRLNSDKCNLI
jgi:hypothetical protein